MVDGYLPPQPHHRVVSLHIADVHNPPSVLGKALVTSVSYSWVAFYRIVFLFHFMQFPFDRSRVFGVNCAAM